MDGLFRPERGGFALLRRFAELLMRAGLVLVMIGVFSLIANLVGSTSSTPTSLSGGPLLGQAVMLFSCCSTLIVAGHRLRGVALVLTKPLARGA